MKNHYIQVVLLYIVRTIGVCDSGTSQVLKFFLFLYYFLFYLIGSMFFGADQLSKFLYEKRIEDFKSNYKNMATNLEGLRDRMEKIKFSNE